MKIAFSNIAWTAEQDEAALSLLERNLFDAVEIAPTRIYPEFPYSHIEGIQSYAWSLREAHHLEICSMQSIWYGKTEKIFESSQQQDLLLDHTNRAAQFARAAGAKNLVFGCPANRSLPSGGSGITPDAKGSTQLLCPMTQEETALEKRFYYFINRMLEDTNLYFALEAVSPMYHTNYLNTTESVFEKVEALRENGYEHISVNLDLGTMISEGSLPDLIRGRVALISHVHVSEPGLAPIQEREMHRQIVEILKEEGYKGYLSVEMAKGADMEALERIMRYMGKLAY